MSAATSSTPNVQPDLDNIAPVFAAMTAMTDYFLTRWETTPELRAMKRDKLHVHYGWNDETIARFRIGFDDGTVVKHLEALDFTRAEILSTGCFRVDSYGALVSRFVGRIVFPYSDGTGITRYFTARQTTLTEKWIKNGVDVTPKYVKAKVHEMDGDGISSLVVNTIFSTHETDKQDVGIIAEGIADAISAAQAGYAVRSPVTTMFKESDAEQIDKLASAWKTAVLVPDMEMNGAGMKGALKTARKLIEVGRDIRIAILPHDGIKAAAEARAEQLRNERIAQGQLVTDDDIKAIGDWKVDLNELLAAPAETNAVVEHFNSVQANTDDAAQIDTAKREAMTTLRTIRAQRKDTFDALVKNAAPALDVMIEALPTEPTPADFSTCISDVTSTIALVRNNAEREAWIGKLKDHTGARLAVLRSMVAGARDRDEADAELDTLATILGELKFFRILTGRVFTTVGNFALPVDGEEFVSWIAHRCLETSSRVVGTTTIKDAIRAVVGISSRLPLGQAPIRFAFDSDASMWIDLADDGEHFIHITKRSVRVVHTCPVAFYRPTSTSAMPLPLVVEKPEECSSILSEFFDFLAVSDASRAGLFAIIMSAMRPMEDTTGALTTYTVGVFNGEHGAGKSTRQKFVRRLIDPREPASMMMPNKVDDLIIYGENSAVISLDNQSTLSEAMSDALCRLATGDGAVKRALFSNRELAVFRGSRPVLANGITDVVTRDDLLDRAIIINVEKPTSDAKKTDAELEIVFAEMWPRVLGAFCFCIQEALGNHEDVVVDRSIRMLQAARWAAAAELSGGFEEKSVETAYLAARQEAVAIAADDPFVAAVLEIAESGFKGTMTALTALLLEHVEHRDPTGKATTKVPKEFPTTTPKVRSAFKRREPALRALGVEITRTFERTANSSKESLIALARQTSNATTASIEPQRNVEHLAPEADANGYDGPQLLFYDV